MTEVLKKYDITKPEKNFRKDICMQGVAVSKKDIKQVERHDYLDGRKRFTYNVNDNRYYYYAETVKLDVVDKYIQTAYCSCPYFNYYGECKHLLGVLINEKEELIKNYTKEEIIERNNMAFLNSMSSISKTPLTKKQLFLNVIMDLDSSNGMALKLKISDGKHSYSLNAKFRNFINVYNEGNGVINFGKNLEYNPEIHYFDSEDVKLISLLESIINSGDIYGSTIYIRKNKYNSFMNLIKNRAFSYVYDGKIHNVDKIRTDFKLNINISKDNNKYYIKNDFPNYMVLFSNYKYLFSIEENKVYEINNHQMNYINLISNLDTSLLVFNNLEFDVFKNELLPIIKDDVVIDDSLKDEIKITKPIEKVCLDLVNNNLECVLKFMYDDTETNYFNKRRINNILRDIKYENEVLSNLIKYGFIVDKNKKSISIDGIDNVVEFISEKLEKLMKDYNVYATDRLKNVEIKRKISAHSSFSIGKDNIMNYTFSMEGIPNKELVNILESLNQKKKYHKLKNGNIIDLESTKDELESLEEFVDELDLTNAEISKGEGILPKYKAIYIDSLKNNNCEFIETDNLFNKLINKFNKYKNSELNLNDEELNILRDYQKVGVKWLKNIHECGFGGILADEMGLGKSIQTLYFILEQIRKNPKFKVLIVVPTALLYNWENEILKFASELKYVLICGNKNERHKLLENNIDTNIIITTYGLLREDHEYYEDKHFDVCIIDEAQNIKNVKAGITKVVKSINADTKFALTGTPLENSVIELWSIFDYIMPGYLSNFHKFSKNYNVTDFEEESMNKLNRLNKQISSFILRRLKKDVIKDLPKKIENNIYIELNPHQKSLYALELERVRKQMEEILSEQGNNAGKFLIFPLLTKLRQICIDPSLYLEDYEYGSSKMDNLIKVVKEICSNNHKILLFSNFKTAIDRVKKLFDEEHITSYVINGSVSSKKRQELVDKFNSDDTNVFLLTLGAGGTGLNLTGADVVIHLDMWWNPQIENQATDRAHRIGQKKVVEVIKFVSKGTIEERILELQNKKRKLSDKIIEGKDRDKNLVSKLTIDDIKNLLSFNSED